jgi:hypothetical protein
LYRKKENRVLYEYLNLLHVGFTLDLKVNKTITHFAFHFGPSGRSAKSILVFYVMYDLEKCMRQGKKFVMIRRKERNEWLIIAALVL